MEYKLGMRVYQQSSQYATLIQPLWPLNGFFMLLDNPNPYDGLGYSITSLKKKFSVYSSKGG